MQGSRDRGSWASPLRLHVPIVALDRLWSSLGGQLGCAVSNPRYPKEFKIQAVIQVTEKRLPVANVAARLGVSTHNCWV